jgi:uncharacterized protein YgiM (DUF1202 family)
MSPRSLRLASSLVGLLITASTAPAQEPVQVQPQVSNSRYQFSGTINSGDVYVRSGPGEAWYETQKLPQGTAVTVVGIKGDWLKIEPPAGSYCLVTKLYVDRRGDGSIGRVTRSDINVRAGSNLTSVKTTVLAQLNVGDEVKILGEQDEYYKIAPPAGTYFYVHKQFVDPGKAVAVNAAPDPQPVSDPTAETKAEFNTPALISETPTTQPEKAAVAEVPATQPAPMVQGPTPEEVAAIDFNKLEAEYSLASAKPILDQPIKDLAARYDAILKNPALPDMDKQTAGLRLAVLKVRLTAQARLEDVKQVEAASAKRDQILSAERDELQKRLDANQVSLYAAVGQIEPSSLQFGAQTLYRLIDPDTGRTLVYLRGSDDQAVKLMGKFVGIRGEAVVDEKLNVKVIPATIIEPVDPAQVNTKVIAGIVPPSLAGKAIQASSSN